MRGAADVAIVGGGLEGVAVAWALVRRGVRKVTVFERNTVGSGGTGKSSGIVRCHYGVRSLAAMAWKGVQVFEELGRNAGFRQDGYVVGVGPEDVEALRENVAMHQSLGIPVEILTADDVAAWWPYLRRDDFAAFAYEPRGGYGDAYRTAQALAASARADGAVIEQNAQVIRVLVAGGQVRGIALANGRRVPCDTVVVAAGPWSPGLLAPLGVDLPVLAHREQILLVAPGRPVGETPVLSDLVSLQYVRKEPDGNLLFGNSDLTSIEVADPDRYHNRPDESFTEMAATKLAHRFPGLPDAAVSGGYSGCYDITPDFNPVISKTPVAGLLVAAGFSGHGFKIAPAVGELVADLITHGASRDPNIREKDFRLSRFAQKDPLRSPHPYFGATELR